jgi:glutathione S-transferase
MIVVHHLNDSRSQRILWLLEELQLPYAVERYQRDPRTRRAPPELKAIHPLGKSPVIADNGKVVAESGAIIDYVIRHHGGGRLQPDPSSAAYDDYQHWLHYAEGSAMTALMILGRAMTLGDAAAPLRPGVDAEVANHLGYIDAKLEGRQYLLGDALTAADIQLSFVGELAAARVGLSGYPNIASWVRRFQARPAYKAAVARGGAYGYAS